MFEIRNAGLKDYLKCIAKVGDMAGFLQESPEMGVYLYLHTYKDEEVIYRFRAGDEITIQTSKKQSGLTSKKFRYVE